MNTFQLLKFNPANESIPHKANLAAFKEKEVQGNVNPKRAIKGIP